MTYLLTTTGTLDIITENDQPVTRSFELSSLIDVSFAAEPSGDELPFQLTMRSPVLRGLDEAGTKALGSHHLERPSRSCRSAPSHRNAAFPG